MTRISEHLRRTQSADGAIVLDVRHGRIFTLNLVGSKILELVDREYTAPEIAEEIAREFGIGTDTAARDVEEFLLTLQKHRLIETHSPLAAL